MDWELSIEDDNSVVLLRITEPQIQRTSLNSAEVLATVPTQPGYAISDWSAVSPGGERLHRRTVFRIVPALAISDSFWTTAAIVAQYKGVTPTAVQMFDAQLAVDAYCGTAMEDEDLYPTWVTRELAKMQLVQAAALAAEAQKSTDSPKPTLAPGQTVEREQDGVRRKEAQSHAPAGGALSAQEEAAKVLTAQARVIGDRINAYWASLNVPDLVTTHRPDYGLRPEGNGNWFQKYGEPAPWGW